MTLERGWRARQEAAIKRAARHQEMFELNRARSEIVGHPVHDLTIVPVPMPAPEPAPQADPIDDDQFDPAVDTAPPAPAPKGRKK